MLEDSEELGSADSYAFNQLIDEVKSSVLDSGAVRTLPELYRRFALQTFCSAVVRDWS